MAKSQSEISQQQTRLAEKIKEAKELGVKDLGRWNKKSRLLSPKEVCQLHDAIEEKRPKDELTHDDLKALPEFRPFLLPEWVPRELYSDLLYVHSFLQSFHELIYPVAEADEGAKDKDINDGGEDEGVKDTNGDSPPTPPTMTPPPSSPSQLTMGDLVRVLAPSSYFPSRAASKGDYHNLYSDALVKVFRTILEARARCFDIDTEWEGRKTTLKEYQKTDNQDDASRFTQLTLNFRRQRNADDGETAETLPVTRQTLTNVVRLTLVMSGRYPYFDIYASRLPPYHSAPFYEDVGYIFAKENPDLLERLETTTLFNLSPAERLSILKVLVDQMSGYGKYRDAIELWAEEIEEVRQKLNAAASAPIGEEDAPKIGELLEQIFNLKMKLGQNLLGLDRAFRSYYCLPVDSERLLLLIERPDLGEVEKTCEEPTPLPADADPTKEKEERKRLMICGGASANCCPVHSIDGSDAPPYLYFAEVGGIDKLLEGLTTKGQREVGLAWKMSILYPVLAARMDKLGASAGECPNPKDFLCKVLGLDYEQDDQPWVKSQKFAEFEELLKRQGDFLRAR